MIKTDKKILREFGYILSIVFVLIFGLLIPWFFQLAWPMWPWIAAMVTLICAGFFPIILSPVFIILSFVSAVIGRVVNILVLSIVFILMIVPIALIFKLLQRDQLQRKYDSSIDSYLVRNTPSDPKHMENPY